jgi:hypothetical protein
MDNKPFNNYKIGFKYAPIWLYTIIYLFTCLFGALLLLSGYRPFNVLYEYFTGTTAPFLNEHQLLLNLLLLFLAPILMWIGFMLAMKLPVHTMLVKRLKNRLHLIDHPTLPWLKQVIFYVLTLIALIQIAQTGSFTRLASWSDYGSWVVARWYVFSKIGFWGFANIYLFVPISAAWILISWQSKNTAGKIIRYLPAAIAIFIGLIIFQKKSVVITLIIFISTWTLFLLFSKQKHILIRRIVLGGAIVTTFAYFVLVVAPIYSQASRTVNEAVAELEKVAKDRKLEFSKYTETQKKGTETQKEKLIRLSHEINFKNRSQAILLYAMMAPLTRTSAPALYYPVVFPEKHNFYGLDIGQDILGFGSMPDDFKVIWHHMNPDIPGAAGAPFQFNLFCQVGCLSALIGSLIIGLMLGIFWNIVLSRVFPAVWSSLIGGMILVLAVYLAIDSVRNSVLVSYGVLWGIIFIVALFILESLLSRIKSFPKLMSK